MENFKTKTLKHKNKILNNLNLKQKEKTANVRPKMPIRQLLLNLVY